MKAKRRWGIKATQELPSVENVSQAPTIQNPVKISFKYIEAGEKFCLCHYEKQEAKNVMDCLRKLTTIPWIQVLQSGGGHKSGLAFTPYKDGDLREVKRPPTLSKEISISSVRASEKSRVWGAYFDHTYYILWFDRNHKIYPMK